MAWLRRKSIITRGLGQDGNVSTVDRLGALPPSKGMFGTPLGSKTGSGKPSYHRPWLSRDMARMSEGVLTADMARLGDAGMFRRSAERNGGPFRRDLDGGNEVWDGSSWCDGIEGEQQGTWEV